ncbi:MAG: cytochrome c biogenesis protein ResB [Actinomycetes bacterium]
MTLTAGPDTALSTAPDPDRPPSGSRLAPLRRAWRQLTSMRTALLLLFLLALAAVPGAFLPQRGLNPVRVQEYFAEHPDLAPVLDRFSLFDVYAAPWFAAVYLLLFVSLVGCLVPRLRLHARALRSAPPRAPARFDRLPASDRWSTDADAATALEAARASLRGWRVVERDGALCAERGYLRETGNLVFHLSLVALLVGIALGGLFGFQGTSLVIEGRAFSSTVALYDDIRPGRHFAPEDLVPFGFTLEDFRAEYDDEGRALDFEADITWTPDAGDPDAGGQAYALRVNHPLSVDRARLYLLGHGYAPQLRLVDSAGEVAFDQPVACLPQDVNFLSSCVVKVPDATGEQYAFEGVLTPTTVADPETGRVTSVHPAPDIPALTLVGYTGDLGLGTGASQSVYRIENRDRLEPVADGRPELLEPGDTWTLPDGATLTWVDTREWVTVQVTQDPGKLLALIASATMIGGMLLSLFVRRRRVWVRARPAGPDAAPGTTVVEAGGLSRTAAESFADEFESLTERLRGATGAPRERGDT